MPRVSLSRRLVAEALGTAFLLAAIVGSGIMAAKLAGGNQAVALLCNALATGAALAVLILTYGPVSGAHFNPAVTAVFAWRGSLAWPDAAAYITAQVAGGILGVFAAHLMFELPLWQLSTTIRTGPGQWFAEAVAAFGLVLTILGCVRYAPAAVAYAVALYIVAAYWFTASTSFANPAVTIARIALRYLRRHRAVRRSRLHRRATRRRLDCFLYRDVAVGRGFPRHLTSLELIPWMRSYCGLPPTPRDASA